MPITDVIRAAVDSTFPPDQRREVIEGLATIPEPSPDSLQSRPPAEELQAAVLVLSYGDLPLFHQQLMNACVEPRDVYYVLQSPGEIRPDLTCAELVRRYRELNLPVSHLLVDQV